jgi:hypothetical protein
LQIPLFQRTFAADMFKKVSILVVFAAILSMTMHSFVPHHEHGEMICFEQMHDNDKGTAAQDDCAEDIHACCFDKQDAVRLQGPSIDVVGYAVCCDHCFPAINSFSGLDPIEIISKPYLNLYTSADIASANALRGPPLR